MADHTELGMADHAELGMADRADLAMADGAALGREWTSKGQEVGSCSTAKHYATNRANVHTHPITIEENINLRTHRDQQTMDDQTNSNYLSRTRSYLSRASNDGQERQSKAQGACPQATTCSAESNLGSLRTI